MVPLQTGGLGVRTEARMLSQSGPTATLRHCLRLVFGVSRRLLHLSRAAAARGSGLLLRPTVAPPCSTRVTLKCLTYRCFAAPHQVVLTILGYGLCALLFCALDEVFPIFAAAPKDAGGWCVRRRGVAAARKPFGSIMQHVWNTAQTCAFKYQESCHFKYASATLCCPCYVCIFVFLACRHPAAFALLTPPPCQPPTCHTRCAIPQAAWAWWSTRLPYRSCSSAPCSCRTACTATPRCSGAWARCG